MSVVCATSATEERFDLAESPVWDPIRQRLLWVDIVAGKVLEGRLAGVCIDVTRQVCFDGSVGAVAVSADGALLVAVQDRLMVIRADGTCLEGPQVIPTSAARRLNDGGTDPAGRFLIGTLSLGAGSQRETLVRLEHDGRLTTLDDDLGLSNGLAWSSDGQRLFSVDSVARLVYARPYDPRTGAIGQREIYLRVEGGLPDGIATDQEDHLWVAVWGDGEVRRYSPEGAVVMTIAVPAPHTSSVAFAGNDLRRLIITTATAELSPGQLGTFPESGRIFTAEVDVAGVPSPPWTRIEDGVFTATRTGPRLENRARCA